MYAERHRQKFIKTGQIAWPRRQPPIIDLQDEIIEMYVAREGVEEGVEGGQGRRFTRWAFQQGLGENHTPAFMARIRQHVNSAFYIRYLYTYVIKHIHTGLKMVYYKQRRGSPWINNFTAAERWLNEEENQKYSSIKVKVVVDNQPMLGTGPLPPRLRNLAHGHVMVLLDTYSDNLCLWCCIAVHHGALPHQHTGCKRACKELLQPQNSRAQHSKNFA